MREHRWESQATLSFDDILSVASKLRQLGLTSIHEDKEMIGYIEEWEVDHPQRIQTLAPWPTEDVTLLHLLDNWQGDFFLLAGHYHSIFQTHQSVNTYCSIAHPWRIYNPAPDDTPTGSLAVARIPAYPWIHSGSGSYHRSHHTRRNTCQTA